MKVYIYQRDGDIKPILIYVQDWIFKFASPELFIISYGFARYVIRRLSEDYGITDSGYAGILIRLLTEKDTVKGRVSAGRCINRKVKRYS